MGTPGKLAEGVEAFVMASEGDSVMWLRVEDEDIDEAKLLRVTVNENTTGNGKKRRTSFVCKGTLYKGKDDHMREYSLSLIHI